MLLLIILVVVTRTHTQMCILTAHVVKFINTYACPNIKHYTLRLNERSNKSKQILHNRPSLAVFVNLRRSNQSKGRLHGVSSHA